MLEPEEAAAELLRRRQARQGLLAFTRYTFPGYRPAPHHMLIADTLDAVARGEKKRVQIFMPPRFGKSELASKRFPAFFLGANPKKNIIAASYNSDLAADFGREVRGIVGGEEYRALFNVELSQDSKSANRWHTSDRGMYVAAGVGGSLTGRGAHCFVAGTQVQTDKGLIAIEKLDMSATSGKILTYNSDRGKLEYKKQKAFSARQGFGIYRVTSASGRVVEATGDHPFYSGGGYVEARSLAPGDPIVLLLQGGFCPPGIPAYQERDARAFGRLLRQSLFGRSSRNKKSQRLQGLRWASRAAWAKILHSVQAEAKGQKNGAWARYKAVSDLQRSIFSPLANAIAGACDLLLEVLFRSRAFAKDVFDWKPQVETWGIPAKEAAAFCEGFQAYASVDPGEGRPRLRGVLGSPLGEKVACSPYRRVADEQRGIQSGGALQFMPSAMAFGEGFEAVEDTVALVERVREEAAVYDLQVEGNANFFANGFLVHNCLIIDDPIKNREEADSEVIREKIWRWYTSTAYTRLENDIDPADVLDDDWLWRDFMRDIEAGKADPLEGAIVVVQTRWHEDDLAGRLLKQQDEGGEKWEVIELPAISTKDGEERSLWPAKYPVERLQKIRSVIGPRDWSALYQQAPAPDEGLYFKKEWFRFYDELPKHLRFYGASDYAVTANGGDYTCHGVGGVDPGDDLYIADVWLEQTESNVWIDVFCGLIKKHKPLMWAEEQGQILKSLGPFIDKRMRELKAYCAREQFTSTADKPTRARSFQARMAMGKVYWPRNAPWLDRVMSILLSFPAGTVDDPVDMLGLMGRLLDVMVGGQPPKAKEGPIDRWKKAFARSEASESDWKVV